MSGYQNLSSFRKAFEELGVEKIYVKRLAPNDNSKNQIYLGGFITYNLFPHLSVTSVKSGGKRDRFIAKLPFFWLGNDGKYGPAPHAQLILYPKYPEVRLSGMLRGSELAPNKIINSRRSDRHLFLGVSRQKGRERIIAYVSLDGDEVINEFETLRSKLPQTGVFYELETRDELPMFPRYKIEELDAKKPPAKDKPAPKPKVKKKVLSYEDVKDGSKKSTLFRELCRIHAEGKWLSRRLLNGEIKMPYKGSNGGGVTLEALLGIEPNSRAGPDFLGWEVKQYGLNSFASRANKALTLMAPHPDSGLCAEDWEKFMWKYGYPPRRNPDDHDRLNFSGVHRNSEMCGNTNLTITLEGFAKGKIEDVKGGLVLYDKDKEIAARWSFDKLLEHWINKHERAVYIPSVSSGTGKTKTFSYGDEVKICIGTDFAKYLAAFHNQEVYYDPGHNIKGLLTGRLKRVQRNQFRVKLNDLDALYDQIKIVNVCASM